MYGNRFYNQLTRKYVAIFGTLFNDIKIGRSKVDSGIATEVDYYFDVPVNYGPMQKFLARTTQDPDFNAPAITLPRMTFEIINMTYDPSRKLTNSIQNAVSGDRNDTVLSQFMPAPYNLDFELNIMTKYNEDGTKILEQILPFFKPEQVLSVELIEGSELYFDVPIILNSVQHTDEYEGDFQTRRALIWTLNFTVKGYYFGPTIEKKVVKFARTRIFDKIDAKFDITPKDDTTLIDDDNNTSAVGESTHTVYFNDFIDENQELFYGISNTESTDTLHNNDANNVNTTPFVLQEPLPEITILAGDTLAIVNESETYRLLLTDDPYDPETGQLKFSVDNIVDSSLAIGMPALNGSTILFTPIEPGSYYYMSPEADDVAGLITVLTLDGIPSYIVTEVGDDDIANNTPTPPVEEKTFTSDRGLYTNQGDLPASVIDTRPGLTIAGEPTTDIEDSLNIDEIDWDDNWGIIVQISDEEDFIPLGLEDNEEQL